MLLGIDELITKISCGLPMLREEFSVLEKTSVVNMHEINLGCCPFCYNNNQIKFCQWGERIKVKEGADEDIEIS